MKGVVIGGEAYQKAFISAVVVLLASSFEAEQSRERGWCSNRSLAGYDGHSCLYSYLWGTLGLIDLYIRK